MNTKQPVHIPKDKTKKPKQMSDLAKRYFELEAIALEKTNNKKSYSTEDIRRAIKKIFIETKQSEIPMTVVFKLIKSMDKDLNVTEKPIEMAFKELKYQEVRSIVKSKKFGSFNLTTNDAGTSLISKVV